MSKEDVLASKLLPGKCFVATAAFNGEDHATVQKLRDYRDSVMAYNPVGRAATFVYHDLHVGQAGAYMLNKISFTKPVVRGALNILARIVEPSLKRRGY